MLGSKVELHENEAPAGGCAGRQIRHVREIRNGSAAEQCILLQLPLVGLDPGNREFIAVLLT